jgi:hypothetical protein
LPGIRAARALHYPAAMKRDERRPVGTVGAFVIMAVLAVWAGGLAYAQTAPRAAGAPSSAATP